MVFLMYHELEADGRRLCQASRGYQRYAVRTADFRAQMNRLKALNMRGINVDDALSFDPSTVAITFDDGCETDLLIAAPILREVGFGATFYITTGFLGKPGYLSVAQLRDLSSQGFQIGSHASTHSYLPDLDDKGLSREIADSKSHLEQLIGKAVEHFSCPGGRFNKRSVQMVRAAGYRTMATSRACSNFTDTDHFALGRIAVTREIKLYDFEQYCRGRRLLALRVRESGRHSAKRFLGNTLYDRMREAILNK